MWESWAFPIWIHFCSTWCLEESGSCFSIICLIDHCYFFLAFLFAVHCPIAGFVSFHHSIAKHHSAVLANLLSLWQEPFCFFNGDRWLTTYSEDLTAELTAWHCFQQAWLGYEKKSGKGLEGRRHEARADRGWQKLFARSQALQNHLLAWMTLFFRHE